MAKSEPAQALLKRLQKIEQAHGRLAEAAARIRATADTIADLVKLAQTFIEESSASATAPKRAPAKRAQRKAAAKRAPVKRAPRTAAVKRAPRTAAPGRPRGRPKASTAASAPAAATPRPRKPASRTRSAATRSKATTPRRRPTSAA
jgi:hypothetical protein